MSKYRLLWTKLLEEEIPYSGEELRSRFPRERARILGDGVVAFIGECDVAGRRLVDVEDAEEGESIKALRMLHFIGEHFQCPLREANWRVRLFASIVKEEVERLRPGIRIERRGDDLFVDARKLTVAIATVSPTSALFHFGINVDGAGAPVPTASLDELALEPRGFARSVLARYEAECESVELAVRKVRGVP